MPAKNKTVIAEKKGDENPAIAQMPIWKCLAGQPRQPKLDAIAREEPLEIRVRGRSIAVTMRTPGHDAELAAGFLLSEGLISKRADILEIAPCLQGAAADSGNVLNVFLSPNVIVDFEQLTRHVFASSSCGLCGKASIDSVHQAFPPIEKNVFVKIKTILALPDKLRRAQKIFAQTGALHGAALFTARGKLLVAREDVGRHNAVDKVIGCVYLQNELPLDQHILLVSGRASFEIMQKALAARIGIVCAVSAPSSLAVEFAVESGQALIGFLREGRMNIYSHPELIIDRAEET